MIPRAIPLPSRGPLLSPCLRPHALAQTRLYASKSRGQPSPKFDYEQWKAGEDKRRRQLRATQQRRQAKQPDLFVNYPRSIWALFPHPRTVLRNALARNGLLYTVVFCAMAVAGMFALHRVKHALGYGEPPETSDEERQARLEGVEGRLEELPVVRALSLEDGWVEVGGGREAEALREELREQFERHMEEEKEKKKKKKKEKPKGGFVGEQLAASKHLLGPRRVWWNAQKGEGISVGWAGSGVAGWPTVVHGGAIATVLLEAVQLAWEREGEGKLGAAKAPSSSPSPSPSPSPFPRVEPLQLDLTYLAPTRANEFYVLRFAPSPPAIPAERGAETDLSPRKDMTKREAGPRPQLAADTEEWTATLEKVEGAKICVKARIVMPKRETKTEDVAVFDEVVADANGTKGAKKAWWKLWA